MSSLPRPIITVLAFLALQASAAACTYPPEIEVPDGRTATEAQMREANKAIKDYMAAVDSYLACLDDEEKALGDAVTEEQKKIGARRSQGRRHGTGRLRVSGAAGRDRD
jgi:hypothetical protein